MKIKECKELCINLIAGKPDKMPLVKLNKEAYTELKSEISLINPNIKFGDKQQIIMGVMFELTDI